MSEIESVDSFRARASEWLAANMERGSSWDRPERHDDQEWSLFSRALQRKVFDGGFAGVLYPKEYGGLGLTKEHQTAFKEEAASYVMPVQYAVTHGILGPTVLDFGSEEQKRKYLPDMLAGDMWVQFLSEPSGGSDMAAALTRATRDGDTFVVNGTKIWSTSAHFADYALALCRTNWDVPKHRGLSMIILPIKYPGITVQPIMLVDGSADFCQEFIDDAVVSSDNLVGTENDGWTVASRLLFHERNMVGGNSYDDTPVRNDPSVEGSVDALVSLARTFGLEKDPVVRQKVGEGLVLDGLGQFANSQVGAGMRSGRIAGPGASMLKLMHAVVEYRRSQLAFDIAGPHAVIAPDGTDPASTIGMRYLRARSSTIAGGTNEMQLNQIAERVLGLPREPNPDKDRPFSETLRRGR